MEKLKQIELLGVIVIFLLFSLLHFLYSETGIKIFKPFSAVNESVWEHLKIGFFAAFFYAMLEYFSALKANNNFIFAKSLALLSIPIFISIIFYSYTIFTGKSILWVDILTAFLSGVISQFISYKIMSSPQDFSRCTPLGYTLITAMLFSFVVFTYCPPKLGIFMEKK